MIIGGCCVAAGVIRYTLQAPLTGQAEQTITKANYVATFYKTLASGPNGGIKAPNINRRGLVKRYCDVVFDPVLADGFPFDDTATRDCKSNPSLCYSPKNSLFVRMLCERVQSSTTSLSHIPSDYLIFSSYDTLRKRANCNRSTNLNDCPMSTYLANIFHTLINDYTNSKIAGIYGYTAPLSDNTQANTKSLQNSIKAFSDTYYGPCGSESSEFTYTNKDQIDGTSEQSHCSHPNTYKVLSNYIQNAKSKIADNKIIDYNKILGSQAKGTLMYDAFAEDCSTQEGPAVLSCPLDDYQHLVMNELMFYGLFMKMYASIIPNDKQFGTLTLGKDASTTQEYLDEESWKAQLELEVADEAVFNTIKIVRNLYAQFPIHIGLVAYLEDLVNFRNELVKLYTPVHQMYYKLRNAQTYAK